jgi:hypothetical protein
MQDEELSSDGNSDHTDSERSVASMDYHGKHSCLTCFSAIALSGIMLLGDAEMASMADRLAVLKSEDAPSATDSAISIERSSVITATTAGVTQFSEVKWNNTHVSCLIVSVMCSFLGYM